ncbi:linker histone H1M [Paramormyrops kingsleyae]|uniref:Protein B4-like n=1 Tax=Paramormyrops kingsleyae TaxID=1676925 RepID=A0A3B3RKM0_9TELE|nr:protein B4-like [Paramormyrops kingsleyae]
MPPRKAPVINTTSSEESISPAADEITNKKKTKTAEVAEPDVGNPTNAAAVRKMSAHPSTLEMIKEALKALDSRKGSSVQAIRGYILKKYPSVDAVRFKHMLRKALIKGLEGGALVRPPNSSATGAQGRFRLPAKNKPKDSQKSMENSDPNTRETPKTEAPVKKVKGKAEASDKPKPAKKPKPKRAKDSVSPEDSGSKVAPVKKPKTKKPAGGKKQEDKVLKPVQTQPSEAGEDGGAPAGKNSKRGKMK